MEHKLIYAIALFLLMLTTGVFWGTWFTLTRSLPGFSAEEFIIGKVIIANVAVPMSIIMPACIVLMFTSMWIYRRKKTTGFYLGVLSLMLIIVVLIVTLTVLVPIDNDIKEWTPSTVPGNWEIIRSKWESFHTIRTFSSLLSFACFSISILADRRAE